MQYSLRNSVLSTALLAIAASVNSTAGIMASATYTDTQPVAGIFEYTLTLNNTGTTSIGTFWFGWIPGAGFLPAVPTNIQNPAGWSSILTNGNASIQWTTNSLLAPGGSVTGFKFDTATTPAQLAGNVPSGLGAGDPITTAFVYIAAPLADPGFQLTATAAATPEPASLLLSAAALGLGVLLRLKRTRS